MGKKKKPNTGQRLMAMIPWQTENGKRYIEIAPGLIIIPDTQINGLSSHIKSLVVGEMSEAILTDEGLIIHTTVTDPKILRQVNMPTPIANSIGYTINDDSDIHSE